MNNEQFIDMVAFKLEQVLLDINFISREEINEHINTESTVQEIIRRCVAKLRPELQDDLFEVDLSDAKKFIKPGIPKYHAVWKNFISVWEKI